MMGLQHERLVEFVGAGTMYDERNQGNVVFAVVEFMSGGSLDTRHPSFSKPACETLYDCSTTMARLWDKPCESVTWNERLRWACDAAEGMQIIHGRGFSHR